MAGAEGSESKATRQEEIPAEIQHGSFRARFAARVLDLEAEVRTLNSNALEEVLDHFGQAGLHREESRHFCKKCVFEQLLHRRQRERGLQ